MIAIEIRRVERRRFNPFCFQTDLVKPVGNLRVMSPSHHTLFSLNLNVPCQKLRLQGICPIGSLEKDLLQGKL